MSKVDNCIHVFSMERTKNSVKCTKCSLELDYIEAVKFLNSVIREVHEYDQKEQIQNILIDQKNFELCAQ